VGNGLQQGFEIIGQRRELLERLLRGTDDLLGRERATGQAAHAVGNDRHHVPRGFGGGEDRGAILLFAAVADVLSSASFYSVLAHKSGIEYSSGCSCVMDITRNSC